MLRTAFPRLILMVALVGLYPFLGGCGSGLTPEGHFERAKEYQAQGDIAAASIELKNVLQQSPHHAGARALLGALLITQGDGAGAEKELRRAIEYGWPAGTVTVPLARAMLLQGRYSEIVQQAVSEALSAESDHPALSQGERATLAALRGHAYLALGNADQAEAHYSRALALQPEEPEALLGLAGLAFSRSDLKEARVAVQRVLTVRPDFARAWSTLGDIDVYDGDMVAAERTYSTAIEKTMAIPGYELYRRGLVRAQVKNYAGAAEDAARLRRLAPKDARGPYVQGVVEFVQGRYPQAQRQLEESLSLDGDYLPALFLLGAVHHVLGRPEQAQELLTRFWNARPGSPEGGRLLAAARLRYGDYAGAEQVLQRLLASHSSDLVSLDLMARAKAGAGKTTESIRYLRTALAAAPEAVDLRVRLGLELLESGAREAGVTELESAAESASAERRLRVQAISGLIKARELQKATEAAAALRKDWPDSPLPLNLLGVISAAQGDVQNARTYFTQALDVDPANVAAAVNLASLDLRAGAVQSARAQYVRALERNPQSLTLLLNLADLEWRDGKTEQAVRTLERAVAAAGRSPIPRLLLAQVQLAGNEPAKAAKTLAPVEEQLGGNPRALMILGEAKLSSGQPMAAVEILSAVARTQPEVAEVHFLLARAHAQLGNGADVARELEATLKLAPDNLPTMLAASRLYTATGQVDRGRQLFESAKRSFGTHPEILYEEGQWALRDKRPADAIAAFQAAIKSVGSTRALVLALARAQVAAGDYGASGGTLAGWIRENPTDAEALSLSAEVMLAQGKKNDARAAYRKAIETKPDDVTALNNAAWLARESGDLAEAQKYGERALELAPENPSVLDTVAMVYVDRGEPQRAVRLIERALVRVPSSTGLQYRLALALAKAGQREESLRVLNELLNKPTAFPERERAESLRASVKAGAR